MIVKKTTLIFLLWTLCVHAGDLKQVFVSILPQRYFVQQIAGDRVRVNVLVMPGADPHVYEPRPRQMDELSRACAYFSVGAPFENAWLPRIAETNKNMLFVKTEEGLQTQAMDPHIWLSPKLVKIQAQRICQGLQHIDAPDSVFFRKNLEKFLTRIDSLDTELAGILRAGPGRNNFLVFHPSWGYFAKDFGLNQICIEIEGREPAPRDLKDIIRLARDKNIKVIFIAPQFSRKSAEMIAGEIGGKTVVADALAENWDENLLTVARAFREALR